MTAPARVRPIAREDVPAVWELLRGLARYERMEAYVTGAAERMAAHLFGDAWPALEGLVAERDGALVGYALFFGRFSTFWTLPLLWLEDLYVIDAERGAGTGRALMEELGRIAVARGCPRMDWEVLDWNAPAMAFYRRMGAHPVERGWDTWRIEGQALRALAGLERAPAPGPAGD